MAPSLEMPYLAGWKGLEQPLPPRPSRSRSTRSGSDSRLLPCTHGPYGAPWVPPGSPSHTSSPQTLDPKP